MNVGNVASAHATDANHPALESSRKKAGYTSFVFVSALTLLAKDMNIGILGYGSIIAMELSYKHAIMANPATGKIQAPNPSVYVPASPANVTTMSEPDNSYNDAFGYGG